MFPGSMLVSAILGNLRFCNMLLGPDHDYGWFFDVKDSESSSLVQVKVYLKLWMLFKHQKECNKQILGRFRLKCSHSIQKMMIMMDLTTACQENCRQCESLFSTDLFLR